MMTNTLGAPLRAGGRLPGAPAQRLQLPARGADIIWYKHIYIYMYMYIHICIYIYIYIT